MLQTVHAAVEGILDEAVVRRLILHAGGQAGSVYGRNGKADLKKRIKGYADAAQFAPWVVLVDLDNDAGCPPSLRYAWVQTPAPLLCFRVAVREIEAWLMADRQTLASFLRIRVNSVPEEPEKLRYQKNVMVSLARKSRSRGIRDDIVPRENSGRSVDPAYASRLIDYVQGGWRPDAGPRHSDSLRRAINCLKMLVNPVVE